jgi:hypothetical protein
LEVLQLAGDEVLHRYAEGGGGGAGERGCCVDLKEVLVVTLEEFAGGSQAEGLAVRQGVKSQYCEGFADFADLVQAAGLFGGEFHQTAIESFWGFTEGEGDT